jgi:hypothetical protein
MIMTTNFATRWIGGGVIFVMLLQGTVLAQSPQAAPVTQSQALPDGPSPVQQPSSQSFQSQHPVGTAAAPVTSSSGIAASEPAGAAIAPAKQRRVRTILISVALVAGAAVAIGTVAALSNASPSKPNGAH